MKLAYKRLLALVCTFFCLFSFPAGLTPRVSAAVAELEIELSATKVEVGDWVSVTLNFKSSENLAGVYARITYDQNILEYTGGDAEGGTGSLTISRMEEQAATTLSYTVNFTAKASGDTTISVVESGMYDQQAQSIGTPTGSRDLRINEQGTLSSDASLKSLLTSYGVLAPAFSPDVTEYTMTVPNSISSVTLNAEANDPTAAVQVSGVPELAVGQNHRQITVIAPDGTTKVYIVQITREAAEESSQEDSKAESSQEEFSKEESSQEESSNQESKAESSQEESSVEAGIVAFKVDGLTMYLQSVPANAEIPQGFEKASFEYQGSRFEIAQNSDESMRLFYLADFKGENGAFYLYDAASDTCLNSVPLYINGHVQMLLDADRGGKVPKGCKLQTAQIDGRPLRVYVAGGLSAAEAREYIVYGLDDTGIHDYYRYAVQSGTLGYYMDAFEEETSNPEESVPENSSRMENSAAAGNSSTGGSSAGGVGDLMKMAPYILLGLVLLVLILVVIIILLVRSYRRRQRIQDDELQYDQTAVPEPLEKEEAAEPEDPEDIQLDSHAFAQWKEATQRIPVMKMTEVQTTTFEAVTGKIPDLENAQTMPVPSVSVSQETKIVPPQEAQDAPETVTEPEEQAQAGEVQKDEYKPLTPEEFFDL